MVHTARFLVGFFLATGVAALVVGVHDVVLSGSRLGVLFPGVLLVLAGILFVGATWRLIPVGWPPKPKEEPPKGQKEKSPCQEPVPAALLVSILLGVYVFFGALAGAGTQRVVVIVVSGVFMAAGFVGFVLFWNEIEQISTARVSAAVVLTVLGLVIGGWEFWYQNQYVPSHLDRAVSVQLGLKKLGEQKGFDVLSATVGYQDDGGRSVVVLGSDYTLTGSTVVRCPHTPSGRTVAKTYFTNALPDPQRSRLMTDVWEVQPSAVLAAGRFVADGKRLAPNVPGSRQLIFYVRHGRYQLLRFRAQVFAISATVPLAEQSLPSKRASSTKPPASVQPIPELIGDDLYDLWKLGDSGWFHDLLSGRRGWIVTRYEIVQTTKPTVDQAPSSDLRVTARSPQPSWSGSAPNADQIQSLFRTVPSLDTTETFADTELPLEPVHAQPAKLLEKEHAPCAHSQAKRP